MSQLWEIAIITLVFYTVIPSVLLIVSRCIILPWKYANVWQLIILKPTNQLWL